MSKKKTEAVNAYLIKNSKGEGEERREKKGVERRGGVGGGGTLTSSQKGWGEFYGCINRSEMTSHCKSNHSKTSVSLCERDRELELEL